MNRLIYISRFFKGIFIWIFLSYWQPSQHCGVDLNTSTKILLSVCDVGSWEQFQFPTISTNKYLKFMFPYSFQGFLIFKFIFPYYFQGFGLIFKFSYITKPCGDISPFSCKQLRHLSTKNLQKGVQVRFLRREKVSLNQLFARENVYRALAHLKHRASHQKVFIWRFCLNSSSSLSAWGFRPVPKKLSGRRILRLDFNRLISRKGVKKGQLVRWIMNHVEICLTLRIYIH